MSFLGLKFIQQNPLAYLYLASYFACMISFWYSQLKVFRKHTKKNRALSASLRTLTLVIWNLGYLQILFFTQLQNTDVIVVGIFLNTLSLSLFWSSVKYAQNKFSAAFNQEVPSLHIQNGPYRMIRHPFYTAYILFYLAIIAVFNSVLMTGLCLCLIVNYIVAARLEENSFLESRLADSYQKYRRETGMFIPKIRR